MEFEHNEQEKLFRAAVREFVRTEVAPNAARWDDEERFPWEAWRQLADLGLCGVALPEAYGGGGGGKTMLCIATEELAYASGGLSVAYLVGCGVAMDAICMYGTESQKREYVGRCAQGEVAFFALTEPEGGSDVAPLRMRYRETADGYVLNGTKLFISNGEESTFGVVFATLDSELRHKGISAFVVDKPIPGLSVGRRERKTGQHCSSTTELVFDECLVRRNALIGEEGDGLSIALECIDESRVTVGAQALGIARAAYDESVRYAQEREAFGRKLGQLQAIQFMLADSATELEVSRLLTYRAAWLIDRGNLGIKESAMAKLYATEAAGRICHRAVQIFGGIGYTREAAVERFARDQRVTEIYEGTSEMQRWAIARQVLGVK
ncbi:MAG: acyl-CoA dehydrogenase family protein [Dehalococcoidia bacterium]|nr:acyl-CoA dehydrogenase family protein [Dehalococcoidia bacterium]